MRTSTIDAGLFLHEFKAKRMYLMAVLLPVASTPDQYRRYRTVQLGAGQCHAGRAT